MNRTELRRSSHLVLWAYSLMIFVLLAVIGQPIRVLAQGQWTTNGNNINNTNTGNVGVGTSAPEQRLHIDGATEVLSTGAGAGFKFRDRTGSGLDNWVWYSTSNIARFYREGLGDVLGITAKGNFGLGTISPTARFHLIGSDGLGNNTAATAPDALFVIGGKGGNGTWEASPGGAGGSLHLIGGLGGIPWAGGPNATGGRGGSINLTGGEGGVGKYGGVSSGAGGDLFLNGGNPGGFVPGVVGPTGANGNIILGNLRGNVGIGTANPSALLTVNLNNTSHTTVNGTGSHVLLANPNTAGQNIITSMIGANTVSKWRTDYTGGTYFSTGMTTPTGSKGAFYFLTGGDYGSGGTSIMTISNTGLDVSGTINATSIKQNGVPLSGSQWTTSGSNINFSSGNVGVGTAVPQEKLHVQCNVALSSTTVPRLVLLAGGNNPTKWDIEAGNTVLGNGLAIADLTNTLQKLVIQPGQSGGIFFPSGNVGIGTTAPGTKFNVQTSGDYDGFRLDGNNKSVSLLTNLGNGSYNGISRSGDQGLIYTAGATPGSTGGGFVIAPWANVTSGLRLDAAGNVGIGTSDPDPAYKLHVKGDVFVSGNIAAKYQDMAEWVPSRQKLQAGTVVVLDAAQSNHVTASSKVYDTGVAGVISASPGVILGEPGEGKVMVATTGRVKVRVDATRAPIRIGDLLVTSDQEGIAMRSQPIDVGGTPIHRPGTLIGKALEPLAAGTGEILVLLSLQ